MSTTAINPATIAKEWDEARIAFATSIMVDTSLFSLAQNLNGLDWPAAGRDETPAEFIDYTYAELVEEFTSRGRPGDADLLVQILRETLAFDQPFEEMVVQTELSAERDNPLLRALARLAIAENFPLELTTLDAAARELCQLEQVTTLGEFAVFAQRLSQGVIVGGHIRQLLNALAHVDEQGLAGFLPFRPGSTGLHLAEALAQAARSPNAAERVQRAIKWFEAEFAGWKRDSATDLKSVSRQLSVLKDSVLEQRILILLNPYLGLRPVVQKRSLWASFIRSFKF